MTDDVPQAIATLTAQGWTYAALGDALSVHRITVMRWATGKQRPSTPKLVLLALKGLAQAQAVPPKKRRTQRGEHAA